MKKIITLLFFVGAFATSFAQSRWENKRYDQYANSSYDNRNYDRDGRGWRHFNQGNIFSEKERDFQIEKINRDFNFRVQATQCNGYLRRRQKRSAIRQAEIERFQQIQMVNERFNCNR